LRPLRRRGDRSSAEPTRSEGGAARSPERYRVSAPPEVCRKRADHPAPAGALPRWRTMLNGLLYAHSGLRYLILVAGAVALAYALFAVFTNRPYDRGLRSTGAAFAGLLHLQVLLGFVLIVSGRF